MLPGGLGWQECVLEDDYSSWEEQWRRVLEAMERDQPEAARMCNEASRACEDAVGPQPRHWSLGGGNRE